MHTRENGVEAGGAVPGGGGAVPGVTGLQVQGGCTQAWLPALRLPSGSQLLLSGTTVSWLLVQMGLRGVFLHLFIRVRRAEFKRREPGCLGGQDVGEEVDRTSHAFEE